MRAPKEQFDFVEQRAEDGALEISKVVCRWCGEVVIEKEDIDYIAALTSTVFAVMAGPVLVLVHQAACRAYSSN